MTTLYPYELSDAALTSVNAQKALEHRANITSIEARVNSRTLSKIDGARQCHEECTSAINLLRTGSALGSREILDILSELRLKRAEFADVIISDALTGRYSRPLEPVGPINAKQIIETCKQQFEDATAVIDLAPAHSTPQMVCSARYNRISAVTTLNQSQLLQERNLPVDWDVKAKIALVDANNQLADHHINAKQKEHAEIFAEVFADIVNRVRRDFVHILFSKTRIGLLSHPRPNMYPFRLHMNIQKRFSQSGHAS